MSVLGTRMAKRPNDPAQRRRPRGAAIGTAARCRRSQQRRISRKAISITFQITRNIRCSNPTPAANFQPRQGRNLCRNRPAMILSPVRGDIIRTMPLLRSLGFHFGRDSTKMPRLRCCRLMTQPQRRRPRVGGVSPAYSQILPIGLGAGNGPRNQPPPSSTGWLSSPESSSLLLVVAGLFSPSLGAVCGPCGHAWPQLPSRFIFIYGTKNAAVPQAGGVPL